VPAVPFAVPRARHFAVLAPPTPGHLNPLQVLGAELAALGHRVTVVHLADAARLVTAPEVGFAPIAASSPSLDLFLARLADPTGLIGLPRMIAAAAGMTRALLDGAPAVLRSIGADAVIADSAEPAGPLVARHLRLPHAVAATGLPLLRDSDVPPPFLGWRHRADAIGRFRNWGGYLVSNLLLRPITRVLNDYSRRWRLDGQADAPPAYVAQCPRGLDFPRSMLPPSFAYGAPWRRPEEDVDLPVDGRPLVFCSLGTLQGQRRALFATMAAACAAVGARAVIGHGGGLSGDQAAALPGDALVRDLWPQRAVLRRSAAAILHGGFNTVLDALAAGVPSVVLPIAFEQPGTAARLARIGASRVLSPLRLTVPALARALGQVMQQPGYRRAAGRLAGEMAAANGAAEAAARISEALGGPS